MGKIKNDQQHIIEALSIGDHMYVWQQVKFVGYNRIKDINDRYAVFCSIVDKFDYKTNNNFIKYYLDRLKFVSSYENRTFYVSSNRTIVNRLKNENISPTDCSNSAITKELKNWSN